MVQVFKSVMECGPVLPVSDRTPQCNSIFQLIENQIPV